MRLRQTLAMTICVLLLAACGDVNRALFVTGTQIGIDADAKKEGVSIGFDRYEGYIGPAYQSGAAPAVLARLQSDLAPINPKIKQLYATGEAAVLVASKAKKRRTAPSLTGVRKIMFFGTGTNLGLKATFAGSAPANVNLGYKRGEFSLIPIISGTSENAESEDSDGDVESAEEDIALASNHSSSDKGGDEGDQYASVLAAIDIDSGIKNVTDTSLGVSQFFATGAAAEALAIDANVQALFEKEAEEGMSQKPIKISDTGDPSRNEAKDCADSKDDSYATLNGFMSNSAGITPNSDTRTEFLNDDKYKELRNAFVSKHCP